MGDISGGPTGGVGHHRKPRRRLRRYITLKYLKDIIACGPAQDRFKEFFGKRALITDMVRALHRYHHYNWEGWLMANARKDVVEAMLRGGAHINVRSGYALRWAAWDRNRSRAKLLLERGARIPRKDLDDNELKWVIGVRKTAGGLLRDWRNSQRG